MKLKLLKIYCLAVLLLLLNVGCAKDKQVGTKNGKPPAIQEPDQGHYTPLTAKLLNSKNLISSVMHDTTFEVVKGVEETDIRYANLEGKAMQLFILKVDLKQQNLVLKVATPFDETSYKKQTVLNMAKVVDKAGNRIVAGVNGDFYHTSTLIPRGIVHKNWTVIKNTFSDNSDAPQQGLSFFGILDNGKPYIGYKNEYEAISTRLKEATGGGIIFLKNKNVVPQSITNVDPRTAIGYTEDNLVYIVVADGRNPAYSNGLTYKELSNIMQCFEVKDAVNLDGGGSSTFMIRNPASTALEVRNKPSDGADREVANAWLVTLNNN